MTLLKSYLGLCRVKVSFFSALSAVSGFCLASSSGGMRVAFLAAGVFLLACGSSALNQYQERELDRLMPRTSARPIPSGALRRPSSALLFSFGTIFSGLCAVFFSGGAVAGSLCLFTVGWYNGVYTCLKRKTAFAIIPGALVGSMPPVIGWVAAGGGFFDGRLLYVVFFFFMWQVPHFWLFLLRYGKEYNMAGLPCPSSLFSEAQLARIVFAWLNSAAVSALLIAAGGILISRGAKILLAVFSLWLMWNGARLLGQKEGKTGYAMLFNRINLYMLLVMAVLSADGFVSRFSQL